MSGSALARSFLANIWRLAPWLSPWAARCCREAFDHLKAGRRDEAQAAAMRHPDAIGIWLDAVREAGL